MTDALWKELLRLPLSQRLEWNPIENALKAANILRAAQIEEIRTQAANTANRMELARERRRHGSPARAFVAPG
jgi:hypothetical protein